MKHIAYNPEKNIYNFVFHCAFVYLHLYSVKIEHSSCYFSYETSLMAGIPYRPIAETGRRMLYENRGQTASYLTPLRRLRIALIFLAAFSMLTICTFDTSLLRDVRC